MKKNEREKRRERETERETERQRDRDREAETETQRERERQTDRQRQTDRDVGGGGGGRGGYNLTNILLPSRFNYNPKDWLSAKVTNVLYRSQSTQYEGNSRRHLINHVSYHKLNLQ